MLSSFSVDSNLSRICLALRLAFLVGYIGVVAILRLPLVDNSPLLCFLRKSLVIVIYFSGALTLARAFLSSLFLIVVSASLVASPIVVKILIKRLQ